MFFKNENGLLLFSNQVISLYYNLSYQDKDSYDYPVDNWYWFDTEEQAREFFGLPPKEDTMLPGVMSPYVI